ncbi:MAG: Wzt carbohydrate-binding domain-containing protein, partial [Candidatus Firestonebacteria bacterium]
VYLTDSAGEKTDTFETGSNIVITMNYSAAKKINNPVFRFIIQTIDGVEIVCASSENSGNAVDFIEGKGTVQCFFESIPLLQNAYSITVGIRNLDGQVDYDLWPNAVRLTITTSLVSEEPFFLLDNSLIRLPSKIIHYH